MPPPEIRELSMESNKLEAIPLTISKLPSLRVLDLRGNHLAVLPKEIGLLTDLRRLLIDKVPSTFQGGKAKARLWPWLESVRDCPI